MHAMTDGGWEIAGRGRNDEQKRLRVGAAMTDRGDCGSGRNDGRGTYAGGRMPPLQRFIRVGPGLFAPAFLRSKK